METLFYDLRPRSEVEATETEEANRDKFRFELFVAIGRSKKALLSAIEQANCMERSTEKDIEREICVQIARDLGTDISRTASYVNFKLFTVCSGAVESQGLVASAQSNLDYHASLDSSVVASAHLAPYAV